MNGSIESQITRIISRAAMVPEKTVEPATPLASLGIGSLEQMECLFAVEEELHVEIDPSGLWQARTVQDVIDAVTKAVSAAAGRPPT
jgi:acyl carrier protein